MFLSLLQESEHINLKVLGQDNAVVQFKIKRQTPLKKLMTAYCERAVRKLFYYRILRIYESFFDKFIFAFTHCSRRDEFR